MLNVLTCLIIAVTDGDTVKVRCGDAGQYQQITVRLAEIDAPEKAQPFGQRSKQALSNLCFGAQATVTPQTTDRYKRTVARLSCNGTDAQTHMVGAGMAWVYDKYVTDRSLYAVQATAQAARHGLWADDAPVPPWMWRKQKPK